MGGIYSAERRNYKAVRGNRLMRSCAHRASGYSNWNVRRVCGDLFTAQETKHGHDRTTAAAAAASVAVVKQATSPPVTSLSKATVTLFHTEEAEARPAISSNRNLTLSRLVAVKSALLFFSG